MACSEHMWTLLKEFSVGNLKGDAVEKILSHLETCDLCSDDLEFLSSLATAAEVEGEALCERQSREALEKVAVSHLPAFARKLKILYTPVPVPAKVLIPLAAGLVLLLAYGAFMRNDGGYRALADLTPAPFVPSILRSDAGDEEVAFSRAMAEYLNGDYGEASRDLSRLVVDEQEFDETTHFYLGVSLLLSDDLDEAIRHLRETAGSSNASMRQKSFWYLAQAEILKGDLAGARDALEKVVADGGEMSQRAHAQLDEIAKREEQ